jgi:hypothetical protein
LRRQVGRADLKPADRVFLARGVRKSGRHAARAYSWMSPPSRSVAVELVWRAWTEEA